MACTNMVYNDATTVTKRACPWQRDVRRSVTLPPEPVARKVGAIVTKSTACSAKTVSSGGTDRSSSAASRPASGRNGGFPGLAERFRVASDPEQCQALGGRRLGRKPSFRALGNNQVPTERSKRGPASPPLFAPIWWSACTTAKSASKTSINFAAGADCGADDFTLAATRL